MKLHNFSFVVSPPKVRRHRASNIFEITTHSDLHQRHRKAILPKKYPGVVHSILCSGCWAASGLEVGQGGWEPPLQPPAPELQRCISHVGIGSIQALLGTDKPLPHLFASATVGAGDGPALMVIPMMPRVGWRGNLGQLQSSFASPYPASRFHRMRESGP